MKTAARRRLDERVARYQAFHAADRGGLMTVLLAEEMAGGLPPLMPVSAIDWADRASCRRYILSKLDRAQAYWAQRPRIDDDELVRVQNLAGVGAIGAAFVPDAVLSQEETTNYMIPPLTDWDAGFAPYRFDPENPWYQAQMWMLEALVEAWDGSFGIVPFTHFGPLDLANQLRGNALFTDVYDHPEALHGLLDQLTDEILKLEQHTRDHYLGDYDLPGCPMGCWTPGTYLSCDAGDMGSPAILRTFEIPYVERLTAAWGGAYQHHHELGIHCLTTWADCANLTVQFLNRDPNTDHLAEVVTEEHLASSFKVALGFIATYDEFIANASRWAAGKCCVAVLIEDAVQAREVMRITHQHRNFS